MAAFLARLKFLVAGIERNRIDNGFHCRGNEYMKIVT